MRKWLYSSILAICVALLSTTAANAEPVELLTILTPGQEVPTPTIPTGINPAGIAVLTFDPAYNTLSVFAGWVDLSGEAMAAHLHVAPPGVAGPILVGLFTTPRPATDLFFTELTLTTTQATGLIEALRNGTLYINIHTALNRPGEIRGNFGRVDIEAIPEPATMVLLGTGLVSIGFGMRKKRRDRMK
jgi:hypothetical protein